MGDIIAQVLRREWKINMVGTIQLDQTGADIKPVCDAMKKRTYGTAVWQHNELNLCVATWADNAVVNTLSNFHCVVVVNQGIQQQGLDVDNKRMRDPAPVDCPKKMVTYYETFHLIDRRNNVESPYIMGKGSSKTHGWTPKLSF